MKEIYNIYIPGQHMFIGGVLNRMALSRRVQNKLNDVLDPVVGPYQVPVLASHHVEDALGDPVLHTRHPDLVELRPGTFITNFLLKKIDFFCPPFQHLLSERLTSLGIRGAPRVPPLNPSETIVLSE